MGGLIAFDGTDPDDVAAEDAACQQCHRGGDRRFWAGSTRGPIPTRWNVSGWPTTYVIDHKGVIRAKGARGAKAEEWIEKLVKEAEAAAKADEGSPE